MRTFVDHAKFIRQVAEPNLRKIHVYQAPISQTAWAKRPFAANLASSLWTDLLMVALLFRLNEFTLSQLSTGVLGLWVPFCVFVASFEVWEFRTAFDSVFVFEDDAVHHFLAVLCWLLLALMATTITPELAWTQPNMLLFSSLKALHAAIKLFTYAETSTLSRSKKARRAARPRFLAVAVGFPFILAVPIVLAYGALPLPAAASLWMAGFASTRLILNFIVVNPSDVATWLLEEMSVAKTNVPFLTGRYAEWQMIQLGAMVLGFVSVPVTTLDAYGVLIFGYVYVAVLNLLAYSMAPERAEDHALVRGGLAEAAWLDLFLFGGLALLVVSVGLRVHLFFPDQVVEPANRHYTWTMLFSAFVLNLVMLLQEIAHGGQVRRLNGGWSWYFKVAFTTLYLVVAGAFVASGTTVVTYVALGQAIVALLILIVQVTNGHFRREIIHNHRVHLYGTMMAATLAMVWLHRARAAIKARGDVEPGTIVRVTPEGEHKIEPQVRFDTTASPSTHHGNKRTSIRRRSSLIASHLVHDTKVIRSIINSRFYDSPAPFVHGHKAIAYKVQWSDLFFDILYMGVLFRLGDFLLSGLGGGYSEISVLLEDYVLGNVSSHIGDPTPARSDAIFVFGALFLAAWSMWQSKLAYGSKMLNNDVAHKIVDMAQGLAVLLFSINVTTPDQVEDNRGFAYAIAGALLAFHLSIAALWVEVVYSSGRVNERAGATARRNIKRDALGIVCVLFSFATIAYGAPLWTTTLLWSMVWFLPFVIRVLYWKMGWMNERNALRDLHRYVIHRLGDGALIILGEGVLQIIRVNQSSTSAQYVTLIVALFIMTLCRIQYFNMDCFASPDKHAQLLAIDAGMMTFFLRSVTSPALVAMAVGMKRMVTLATDVFVPEIQPFAWLTCGACVVALSALVFTFETHRFAYHRQFRLREASLGVSIALCFLLWPWISQPAFVILGLVMATFAVSVVVQYFVDDYVRAPSRARALTHIHAHEKFDRSWHRLPRAMTRSTASGLRSRPTAVDLMDNSYRRLLKSIRDLRARRASSAELPREHAPPPLEITVTALSARERSSSNPLYAEHS